MSWHDAMNNYGSDKPDIRFEMKLIEMTKTFSSTSFKAFAGAESIKGICVRAAEFPQQAASGRNKLDGLTDRAKKMGAKGLVWIKVGEANVLDSPVAKFFSADEQSALLSQTGAKPGDLILIVADSWSTTCNVLGQLRNDLGRPPVHEGPYRYVWVVDFPLFVGVNPTTHKPQPGHHPFCHPHPEDLDRLETDPLSVRALAYELVLIGWELGSGSIRSHEPDLQRRVFRQLGISDTDADTRFGFFLQP
ncbi:MAG: amino acid--tRNA ligase-related protein, partial [Actinomycetota bacterium]